MDVAAGTIVVWSDIGCPWAHRCVHRLHETRARLGLDDAVRFDHRAFPLELHNERPTPRPVLSAEIPVVGALDPAAGWQVWQAPDWQWPSTTLLALEAVQAAKAQGLAASEQLDRALRRAFFGESRCISILPVVLHVASACPGVDADVLGKALRDGEGRLAVIEQFERSQTDDVKGSPHLFLADGSDWPNPGVEMHWEGKSGRGFPVVDGDDPSVYDEILRRAAATSGA
ncbi:MAG TPA: DsbA family protein [Acidimicrobiia bacterium]|nr:DsbA family protein [Acidimicrobiia bacterium]